MLFHMCHVFSSLQGHLHFILCFFPSLLWNTFSLSTLHLCWYNNQSDFWFLRQPIVPLKTDPKIAVEPNGALLLDRGDSFGSTRRVT